MFKKKRTHVSTSKGVHVNVSFLGVFENNRYTFAVNFGYCLYGLHVFLGDVWNKVMFLRFMTSVLL